MKPEQISRYPVLRSLGSGGMGDVFLARDTELDRDIALKVLRADQAADPTAAVDQLRAEARAVAGLRHPNIVTVYEIGAEGEHPFIAMEYIDGGSLRSQIDNREIDRDKLLKVGAKVARALEAAHAAGVLHRDIKPDNVMLDRQGVVKVVDFGIALRLDGTSAPPVASTEARIDTIAATIPASAAARGATAQTIFGTPAYMAPEVIFGEPPLPTSDVYALGVVLFEGLTGELPYRAGNALDALTQAADPTIEPLSLAELAPDVRPELVALVESMLAHDAMHRPTAAEVAAALESMTAPTTTVVAPRLPTVRPAQRGPWIAAAVAVIAAAAAVIALVMSRGDTEPLFEPESKAAAPESGKPRLTIAVAPVDGDFSSLGHSALSSAQAGAVLASTLEAAGVAAEAIAPPGGHILIEAKNIGADMMVTSELELGDSQARGSFTIVDVKSGYRVLTSEVRDDSLAGALAGIARGVLGHLDLDLDDWSETSARVDFELGLNAYHRQHWPQARAYLEQAVEARRDFPSAWFYLAWARGWHGAPAEVTEEAARMAVETATTPLERGLGEAMVHYVNRRFHQAAETVEPLLTRSPRDRDLLYTYAESLFHDGQIEKSLPYFERCAQIAPRFLPAYQHLYGVAIGRKDTSQIRRWSVATNRSYAGLISYLTGNDQRALDEGVRADLIALVRGDFEELDKRHAASDGAKSLAYVVGRAAMRGDRASARARFAELWPELAKAADKPHGAFALQILGRALIMGGYPDEVAVVQSWWTDHEAPVNLMARQELAVFGAPLTGADLPIRSVLTTRMARAADAIAAERAGDLDKAISIFSELERERDGRAGDYVIAHALARTLAAAGRKDRLAELCADWRRPGFYEPSIVALWAACDELVR